MTHPLSTTEDATDLEELALSSWVGTFLVRALETEELSAGASRHGLDRVAEVTIGRGRRSHLRRGDGGQRTLSLMVPDMRVSGQHARLRRAGTVWLFEDAGSRNGSKIDGAPVTRAELHDGALIEVGSTLFLFRVSRAPLGLAEDLVVPCDPSSGLETLNPEFEQALHKLERVAASQLSFLLLGETGTGKEVVAQRVHARSGRAGAFVPVNCGALPEALVEALLFGHTRGAFTGAHKDEAGLVRSADGGTLFLDEVADLTLGAQAALLRVLQTGDVTPVGGTASVRTDLRVIAATHKDLDAMMQVGLFRRDLYARLAGYVQTLPPLRERKEDLGLLISRLLARHTRGAPVQLRVEAARALFGYPFPLNVRELEQCLSSALVLADRTPIARQHLPERIRGTTQPDRHSAPPAATGSSLPPRSDEDRALYDALVTALRNSEGNVSETARRMGKARQQIQKWLRRFGVDPGQFKVTR